jgi:hypothetical protein
MLRADTPVMGRAVGGIGARRRAVGAIWAAFVVIAILARDVLNRVGLGSPWYGLIVTVGAAALAVLRGMGHAQDHAPFPYLHDHPDDDASQSHWAGRWNSPTRARDNVCHNG